MKTFDLNSKYKFGLGAFRFLLAIFVIASHTEGYYKLFNFDVGTIAVGTFFFISGFLMPLTFEKNYHDLNNSLNWKKFYFNRFIRIFPIYWSTLIVILVLYLILSFLKGFPSGIFINQDFTFVSIFQNFLLLGINQSNFWGGYFRLNNPAWSLDIELQYYILVPFLVFLYNRFRFKLIFSLILISFVSLCFNVKPIGTVDIDRSLIGWSFYFFLGFILFKFKSSLESSRYYTIYYFSAFIVIVFGFFSFDYQVKNLIISFGLCVFSVPLLFLQMKYKFNKFDKVLGDYSYPIYISHINNSNRPYYN